MELWFQIYLFLRHLVIYEKYIKWKVSLTYLVQILNLHTNIINNKLKIYIVWLYKLVILLDSYLQFKIFMVDIDDDL